MITADEPIFPNNVVLLTKIAMAGITSGITILGRPLRSTDPDHSIGIFGQLWDPDESSMEMHGFGINEPTLQQYLLGIQAFVKHGDEEQGLAIHSILSSRVRGVLYRNQAYRASLAGLSASDGGVTETLKRWGVRSQRYLSNEINAEWVYLSTLEFWIETETR